MAKKFSLFQLLLPKEHAVGICQNRKAQVSVVGQNITIEKLSTDNASLNAVYSSCIDSTKTLARAIKIALTKPKDVDAAFAFEAESHLP